MITTTGVPDVIGKVSSANSCLVRFFSTIDIDKWECRTTFNGQNHGVGMGLLIGSGNVVTANNEVELTAPYSALTFGDGMYRIDVYIQKDNNWYGG